MVLGNEQALRLDWRRRIARRLRSEPSYGWSYPAIGRIFNVSRPTVIAWCDEDYRRRKLKRAIQRRKANLQRDANKSAKYRNRNSLSARVSNLNCKARREGYAELSITSKQLVSLLKDHSGFCDMCGVKSNKCLHIEHDHASGEFRGLVCGSCNTLLGSVQKGLEFGLPRVLHFLREGAGYGR